MSHSKRANYSRDDFQDKEIQEEMQEAIQKIRDKKLTKVNEAEAIASIYQERKNEKKQRKRLDKGAAFQPKTFLPLHKDFSDDEEEEEGQIHEKQLTRNNERTVFEGEPSISDLCEHIRALMLTRSRLCEMLPFRRFDDLVRGCFVRYPTNSSKPQNSYVIAQIIGVIEGTKEYTVDKQIKTKTKVLLKLQESSEVTLTLSVELISNQVPSGSLDIQNWVHNNRTRIPTQRDLKQKLQELKKLLIENLSADEIDSKILQKAIAIAELGQELKEDATHLVDFLADKIHSLEIEIEELQLGRKKGNFDLDTLVKSRIETKATYEKLKTLNQRYLLARNQARKEERPREKKHSWNVGDEKRKDTILQKVKARQILMSTHEGFQRLRNSLIQQHNAHAMMS